MGQPLCINTVDGWSQELAALLWPGARIDDWYFRDLNCRVVDTVAFRCVVFARFPRGIVAIDCNDCDTFELCDERIRVYVKLQFNPAHAYQAPFVSPFTYVPQRLLVFLARRSQLRADYLNAPKEHLAWGRFIAVSLDRFHVAHAMRALGVPGGSYVTCSEGYEGHALDRVKGRERLPFEEYLNQMYRARSVIDARGFGDLTHRTVEALGLGIPLIRPRLQVATRDPLLAGVHYLDCGSRGEALAESLAAIASQHQRDALRQAGLAWFDRNCTKAGIVSRFEEVLDEAELSGYGVR